MVIARESARRPTALIILDGWGYAPAGPGNAIELARTPVWDALLARYPHVLLEASGEAVGLPPGVMGNSEVGHLTIGSGRVIYQDLSRINRSIADGSFFHNSVLTELMQGAIERGKALHLMGLVSKGGVHSSLDHVWALVRMAQQLGVTRVFIHAFTDGRDTSPTSGEGYIEELDTFLSTQGLGAVATISGRYYAMDRDRRWERIQAAYDALVLNRGLTAPDAITAVRAAYARGETDEFIQPTIVGAGTTSRIADGDSVFFFNFRPDRAREISRALTQEVCPDIDRGSAPPRIEMAGMTEYDPGFDIGVAFPKEVPQNVLAAVVSAAHLTQLHIAETEKWAHVTYFFNGGREAPFPGEIRKLIPSRKDVATYDLAPAMSAYQIAEEFTEFMRAKPADFTVLNFANPDMVGHTGNLTATVEAVEHVDICLGSVLKVLHSAGARVMITGDHGNAEYLLEPDGQVNTAHSLNPVPLVLLEEGAHLREGAGLSDIAPTLLRFLDLPVPPEMTGICLCE